MAGLTNIVGTSVVLFGFGLFSSSTARADETPSRDESSYSSLVDEPSREQLFQEQVIPTAIAEVAAEAKAKGEDITNLALPADLLFSAQRFEEHRYRRVGTNEPRRTARTRSSALTSAITLPRRFFWTGSKTSKSSSSMSRRRKARAFKDDNFADFWTRLAGGDSVGRDHVRRNGVPADARIPRGAYHFLSSSSSATGIAQANAFVDYVNLHGGFKPNDLPPTVDLEWDATRTVKDQWLGHDADEIVAKVLDCLKQIEKRTNRKPVLYTARGWWTDHTVPLSRIGEFSAYQIWLADYNPRDKQLEKPHRPSEDHSSALAVHRPFAASRTRHHQGWPGRQHLLRR